MRVVLDTSILVSALISPTGKPAAIYNAWVEGKSRLLTCAAHLEEVRSTLLKPRVGELVKPYRAGRLVNQIKSLAQDTTRYRPSNALPIPRTIFCWPCPKRVTPNIS